MVCVTGIIFDNDNVDDSVVLVYCEFGIKRYTGDW